MAAYHAGGRDGAYFVLGERCSTRLRAHWRYRFRLCPGLIALKLELISFPVMLIWCGAAMFLCGWLALGKRPYQALLIGITLSVVVGAPAGDMTTALWRSGDVILGSLLAMLFTGIWPQRAFLHWRIQMANYVTAFNRVYQAGFSPNLVERPRLENTCKRSSTMWSGCAADYSGQQRNPYP